MNFFVKDYVLYHGRVHLVVHTFESQMGVRYILFDVACNTIHNTTISEGELSSPTEEKIEKAYALWRGE